MRATASQDCPEGEMALLDELSMLLHQVRYDQVYPSSETIFWRCSWSPDPSRRPTPKLLGQRR
eukprot:6551263-Pyramimonas_sp.AAC.1